MDESRRVWKPKSSVGGPRHFLSMVWLVRLQPRLYLDDEVRERWCSCCSSGYEYHLGCSQWWHRLFPDPIRHPQGVWCWGFVQWYPGRLSVHHCRMWQHGMWQCLCHWGGGSYCLSSCIHTSQKAQNWWPCGCLPSALLLWCLGSYGFRIVWLGQGHWPLPWLEWIRLYGEWRWVLPDWHWCSCPCSPRYYDLGYCRLVSYHLRFPFLRPQEVRYARLQWPGWSLRIGKTKASKICGRFGYRPHAVKMVSIQITTILASPIFPKAASCRADSTKNHGQSSTQWRLVRVRDQTYLAAIAAIAAGGCQTHQGGIVRLPMKASQNSACSV